jgi:hypothetical protein
MKKMLAICFAIVFLLNACGSASSVPAPTINFQLIGSDGVNNFAIIEPTDRDGLLSVANFICKDSDFCYIYFWNNTQYAASSFPLMEVQEEAIIAKYRQNQATGQKEMLICSLGEC